MNLRIKWHLRQIAAELLLFPMSSTTIVIAFGVLAVMKFYWYGQDAFPEVDWPKRYSIQYAMDVLWTESLRGLTAWLLVTIPLDRLIKRLVFKLHD